ncbi:MAG: hypothetical protein EAZ89_10790 [Bacteroidetes bacterium]|nr:MAG: hypothetical protein EAZ89_10790 [Bacteroidota bacterium]
MWIFLCKKYMLICTRFNKPVMKSFLSGPLRGSLQALLCLCAPVALPEALYAQKTVLYTESFENWSGTPAAPAGWTSTPANGCTGSILCYWNREDELFTTGSPASTGCGDEGHYARCHTSGLNPGQVPALTSASYDLSSQTGPVSIGFCFINGNGSTSGKDTVRVSFSPNNGQTWKTALLFDYQYDTWRYISIPVADTLHTSGFRIKFEALGFPQSGDLGIDELEVFAHPPLSLQLLSLSNLQDFQISCAGGNDGAIASIPAGGVKPYGYSWEGYTDTNDTLSNLSAGTYTLTLYDHNGYSVSQTITLTEPPPLSLSFSTTPDDGSSSGAITASTTGGVAPYIYQWASGETSASLSGLPAGTYRLTLTDFAGCSLTDSVSVIADLPTQEDCIPLHMGFTPNGDGFNELWHIPCIAESPGNTVTVLNRWGQVLFREEGYSNTWNGEVKGVPIPDGTYYYVIELGGSDLRQFKGTLSILR